MAPSTESAATSPPPQPNALAGGVVRRQPALALRQALESRGGLFTAFARYLSFRADLIRPEHIDALRGLHESAPPMPPEEVESALTLAAPGHGAVFHHEPLWSTVSRCAYRAEWRGADIVVQAARSPASAAELRALAAALPSALPAGLAHLASPATIAQFEQWLRLSDGVARERAYLEAAARMADRLSVRYPELIPDLCGPAVLCWKWVPGRPVNEALAASDRDTPLKLSEMALEQISVLAIVDADFDPAHAVIASDGRLSLRRVNRLIAIPPPRVSTALRYLSAVFSANSMLAARSLAKLAWGRTAPDREAALLDELAGLPPELKGNRRFPKSAAVFEGNWRALERANGERPLVLDAMHANLVACGYWNAEITPDTDCLADAQWPVMGRLLRAKASALANRESAGEWAAGSGLLMFEGMRQLTRMADEFRENDISIGVDHAGMGEDESRAANRAVGGWIAAGVFFVVFVVAVRWASELPAPYSALGGAVAAASACGLFWTVSRIG